MQKAEANALIAQAQSGNRKRRKANMLLLNKILLMDLFRQKKQSGAISMNDCHGCFDRISNTVAILVLMSFGLAHTAAKVLFEVLQHAEHRIKTGFGVSKPAYGISFPPLAGTGQGNPAGPVCWTLISSIMIKVMKKRGHYVEMRSALSLSLISIVCFAFVDDTDLPISGKTRTTTGEELQQPFQEALDAWAHLISVTGGELCPKKSWCYIIDFVWTGKNGSTGKKMIFKEIIIS